MEALSTGRFGSAVFVIALGLLAAAPAPAHTPPPVHECNGPQRPVDDQDDRQWRAFLGAVDEFRSCISGFAEEHHAAADRHRDSANAAIMDWNQFVRSGLNVPQDFPWPPEPPAGGK
jgi:hypothetical protein